MQCISFIDAVGGGNASFRVAGANLIIWELREEVQPSFRFFFQLALCNGASSCFGIGLGEIRRR